MHNNENCLEIALVLHSYKFHRNKLMDIYNIYHDSSIFPCLKKISSTHRSTFEGLSSATLFAEWLQILQNYFN